MTGETINGNDGLADLVVSLRGSLPRSKQLIATALASAIRCYSFDNTQGLNALPLEWLQPGGID